MLKVALIDAHTRKTVSNGIESSAKVEIVVLEGDFDDDVDDNWTLEEFNTKETPSFWKYTFKSKEGIGLVGDLYITDNSSWTRNRKFRLGAQIVDTCDGIREAKSIQAGSTDKAERLLADAASYGSQLVVFPEAFVGAYPRGSNFGVSIGKRTLKGKEDFRKYHDAAINVPGPEVDRLSAMAGKYKGLNGREDESQQHEGTRMPDCRAASVLIKFEAVIGLGLYVAVTVCLCQSDQLTCLAVYDQIRNIRQIHLKTKIRIRGVDCNKCGSVLGAFFQNSYSGVKVVPAKSAN
ncbi:hypothetical protein L6452_37392 [Arctium lappa]|uniref:Uncharacterized protein n=1 Tax=Arctium lappa TaxID=4217 RepID=A0ACB8Y2W0_ARCLA|nr:hypothetical protein L6452_37392 [Arctium lappa]